MISSAVAGTLRALLLKSYRASRVLSGFMNTPAHAIINLLLFGKKHRKTHSVAIVAGALMPDLPMLLFYLREKLHGTPERLIWSERYNDPVWQAVFNSFHSFPLLALAIWMAWRGRCSGWAIFFASMFCHSLFDFPVHHRDAHAHFFPLSDYRFISPLSYWDPAHYGLWISALEVVIMVVGSLYLWRSSQSRVKRVQVAGLLSVYLLFLFAAVVVWA